MASPPGLFAARLLLLGASCLLLLRQLLLRWSPSVDSTHSRIDVERALDAAAALAVGNTTQCGHDPPLRLNWLPRLSTGSVRHHRHSVQPFLLLHETHVSELWFSHLLRANGVAVFARPPARGGSVRDAARRWLQAVARGTGSPSQPPSRGIYHANGTTTTSTAATTTAVGLALTPSALRILNHGMPSSAVGAPSGSHGERPPSLGVRVITLSRRNRLKHAVSTLSRPQQRASMTQLGQQQQQQRQQQQQQRQPKPPPLPSASVDLPPEDVLRALETGMEQRASLVCAAREVVAHGSRPSAHAPGRSGRRRRRRRRLSSLRTTPPLHRHQTPVVPAASPSASALASPRSAPEEASLPPASPAPPLHLEVFYEDLLYDTAGTLRAVLHFLGGGSSSGLTSAEVLASSSQPAGLALALPLKRAPNSLCARLRNFEAVCARLQGTPWLHSMVPPDGMGGAKARAANGGGGLLSLWQPDDRFVPTSETRQCWASACGSSAAAHLVLGGSHHKTGTVLLERLLGVYASATGADPFHKPSWERCPSLQRKEGGVCVDEHLAASKLRRFYLGPLGAAQLLGAPLVHAVREPLEACVSAYQYHLHSSESWLRQPRQPSAASQALGISPALARVPWQDVLRRLDLRSGALAECRRSIADQVSQQAEAFNATRDHPNVFTLRMEETQGPVYDQTMRRLYGFLVGARAHWPGAPAAPRAQDSEQEVARLVEAAARFDISRHRSANDDGQHLSSLQQKRQLRIVLLNATGLARELDGWRAATGYDREYRDYCQRYGLEYYAQAVSDGLV